MRGEFPSTRATTPRWMRRPTLPTTLKVRNPPFIFYRLATLSPIHECYSLILSSFSGADFLMRALTKNYYVFLHFWLLVCPMNLACDWSSFGIPNIESLRDPRNLETFALYASLVCCGAARRKTPALILPLNLYPLGCHGADASTDALCAPITPWRHADWLGHCCHHLFAS